MKSNQSQKYTLKQNHLRKTILYMLVTQILMQQPYTAQAYNLVYHEEGESAVDFEAKKLADPSALAFDEYQIANAVTAEQKEKLIAAYLKAQQAHLNNVHISNVPLWREVILHVHKADWAKPHREMISTAYLRLAELATTANETESLIREAVEFDQNFEPNANDFTTRTLDSFRLQKKAVKFVDLDTSRWKGYTYLTVNGVTHKFDESKKIKVGQGTKRFTLVSPTYKAVTQIASAQKMNAFSPSLLTAERVEILAKEPERYLQPRPHASIDNKFLKDESQPLYEKSMFWVGVAAVVGGYLIYQNEKNNESSYEPTKKVGF